MNKLYAIEKKVDKLIILMDGLHGAKGLVNQVYSNKKEISEIKKLLYRSLGVISVILPLIFIIFRNTNL